MGRIKGITVTLIDKVKTGQDDFGHSTFEESEVQVENVLVTPTTTDDIVNQMSLTGKKAVYTHWPFQKETLIIGKTKKCDFSISAGRPLGFR